MELYIKFHIKFFPLGLLKKCLYVQNKKLFFKDKHDFLMCDITVEKHPKKFICFG